MTKYSQYKRVVQPNQRRWTIHPIWRGIGCVLLILVPLIAYAAAILLVNANLDNHWVPVTPEFYQTVSIPQIGAVPHLYANLTVSVLLIFAIFGILTVVYALVYKVVGPDPLGPTDSEPIRISPKKRRKY